MSSDSETWSDGEMEHLTSLKLIGENVQATNLLPAKSESQYKYTYDRFMKWRLRNDIDSFSEDVMVAYFEELSNVRRPTSLWVFYSMLKATINLNHNVDITHYSKLQALLKRKSHGIKSKTQIQKSKTLTRENIDDFLENAPDDIYLFMKVVLIIGTSGACRKHELRNIASSDIRDTGKNLIININGGQRSFVVSEHFYPTVKKYMAIRSAVRGASKLSFFLNYVNGKCTKQCVGINKLGMVPRQIATYLGLPDAAAYTGHCFRRSFVLVDSDTTTNNIAIKTEAGDLGLPGDYMGDGFERSGNVVIKSEVGDNDELLDVKRHDEWQSFVADGCLDSSLDNQTGGSSKISPAIASTSACTSISEHFNQAGDVNVSRTSTISKKPDINDILSLLCDKCSAVVKTYYSGNND